MSVANQRGAHMYNSHRIVTKYLTYLANKGFLMTEILVFQKYWKVVVMINLLMKFHVKIKVWIQVPVSQKIKPFYPKSMIESCYWSSLKKEFFQSTIDS